MMTAKVFSIVTAILVAFCVLGALTLITQPPEQVGENDEEWAQLRDHLFRIGVALDEYCKTTNERLPCEIDGRSWRSLVLDVLSANERRSEVSSTTSENLGIDVVVRIEGERRIIRFFPTAVWCEDSAWWPDGYMRETEGHSQERDGIIVFLQEQGQGESRAPIECSEELTPTPLQLANDILTRITIGGVFCLMSDGSIQFLDTSSMTAQDLSELLVVRKGGQG